MILVVDNYDSFTFNLVQALQAAGAEVTVLRNDAIDREGLEAMAADPEADLRGIVISPGPSDPDHAGVSMDAVKIASERQIPLLGVCLGMQSMAAAYGASIVRDPTLVHGEATEVTHDGAGLLEGMPPAFMLPPPPPGIPPPLIPPPMPTIPMPPPSPPPMGAMPGVGIGVIGAAVMGGAGGGSCSCALTCADIWAACWNHGPRSDMQRSSDRSASCGKPRQRHAVA